jgi:hypothetical protein
MGFSEGARRAAAEGAGFGLKTGERFPAQNHDGRVILSIRITSTFGYPPNR